MKGPGGDLYLLEFEPAERREVQGKLPARMALTGRVAKREWGGQPIERLRVRSFRFLSEPTSPDR